MVEKVFAQSVGEIVAQKMYRPEEAWMVEKVHWFGASSPFVDSLWVMAWS
jgi:hypothetical protein